MFPKKWRPNYNFVLNAAGEELVLDSEVLALGPMMVPPLWGDCQNFRLWAGIMGKKESHYVSTQGGGLT